MGGASVRYVLVTFFLLAACTPTASERGDTSTQDAGAEVDTEAVIEENRRSYEQYSLFVECRNPICESFDCANCAATDFEERRERRRRCRSIYSQSKLKDWCYEIDIPGIDGNNLCAKEAKDCKPPYGVDGSDPASFRYCKGTFCQNAWRACDDGSETFPECYPHASNAWLECLSSESVDRAGRPSLIDWCEKYPQYHDVERCKRRARICETPHGDRDKLKGGLD